MTDPRITELRKLARKNGWHVRTITRAKRLAPVPLECSRIYRAAWSPGERSGRDQWQYVQVYIDPDEIGGDVRAFQTFMPSHPYVGVDAIAAILRSTIPEQEGA